MILDRSVEPPWWGGPSIVLYNSDDTCLAVVPVAFLRHSKCETWEYLTDVAEDIVGTKFRTAALWRNKDTNDLVNQGSQPVAGSYTITLQGESQQDASAHVQRR